MCKETTKNLHPIDNNINQLDKNLPLSAANELHLNENNVSVERKTNTIQSDNKNTGRGEWSNQFEFILATLGFAVGLGNVWRFPYLVYKNGGGTFLIPYFIMLLFAGLPLFFLELVLGQYSGQGPAKLFGRISPIFKGLGFAMVLATFFVSIYYNVIVAWTLFYMFKGFSSVLPWSSCTNDSSYHCTENFTTPTNNETNLVGASEDFYMHQMLGFDKEIDNWDSFGVPKWQMVLCLFGAWSLVCLSLIKGVKSSGKVSKNIFFYNILNVFQIYLCDKNLFSIVD